MLTLQVANIYTDILGGENLPESVWKDLRQALSFRPEGFQFSPQYRSFFFYTDKNDNKVKTRRKWDGWTRQFWKNTKRTYFPTGLLSIVRQFLDDRQIAYQTQNVREKPEPNFNIELIDNYELRPYQLRVIKTACEKSRGIIHAATGSGKTSMGAGIIAELDVAPFMFFVTSIDLLTQAKESLEAILKHNGSRLSVGQIGGGIIDIQDVNVCTIQTAVRAFGKRWDQKYKLDDEDSDDKTPIEKYRNEIQSVIRSAKGSISDEVQHWKASTCQLVAKELKSAYFTFGLSATPFRNEGDDLLIQACFGKKIAEITASELIREGYLMKPDIKMVHVRGDTSSYKQWQSIYKEQVVENESYNAMVANIANAYIQQGRYVLVLIKHINHGEMLSSMIPGSVFLSGQSPKKKREAGIKNLRNKYISCIISSVIFDEGVDIRSLDTVILAGQGKSKTRAMQRIGRIIRPYEGKTKATAIDFCIHQKYLKKHAIEREKMYRTEPEFVVEDIDPQLGL